MSMNDLDVLLGPPIRELGEIVEGWPSQVEHLSASALGTFARCPDQYRRRYCLGEINPPGIAALWGRADHKAVEFNFRQKIDTAEDLPTGDVVDVFAEALDREIEGEGGVNAILWKPDEKAKKKQVIADAKDIGVKLVTAYHENVAPLMQPTVVESMFEIDPTTLGIPVKIIGYLDLIARPDEERLAHLLRAYLDGRAQWESALDVYTEAVIASGDNELPPAPTGEEPVEPVTGLQAERIVDRKTVGRKESKPPMNWQLQGAIYQLGKWLPIEFQQSVKTKTPYVHLDSRPVTQDSPQGMVMKASPFRKRWIERYIKMMVLEIGHWYTVAGPDEPWPAAFAHGADAWKCEPHFCGYRNNGCPWWAVE